MDVEREFLRGVVPVHVLHHASEEPVHGAWMATELGSHGYDISPGTLYPLLHRMEHAGLLHSRQRTSDGRVRRCYRTTRQGQQALERLRALVGEMASEILDGRRDEPIHRMEEVMTEMASVRYVVDDVDAAIDFYTTQLGFTVEMHPAAAFAMLTRGALRLMLAAPLEERGHAQATADGRTAKPGGWNRFQIEVAGIEAEAERLRAAGVPFRGDLVTGVGAKQVLVEDPAGNPVELFERL